MSTPRILVIGDLLFDIDVHVFVDRHLPGNVPVYLKQDEVRRPGGAGAVASMLAALGANVWLSSLYRTNQNCDLTWLYSHGIRTDAMVPSAREYTFKRRHFENGTLKFRVDEDWDKPIDGYHVDQLEDRWPKKLDAVIVSDYGKGIVTSKMMRSVCHAFGETPTFIDPAKGVNWKKYHGPESIMVANRMEAGVSSLEEAKLKAQHMVERTYFAGCCIKLDSDGYVMKASGHAPYMEPSTVSDDRIVDTVGAGDQFLAALALTYVKTQNWQEACHVANVAAGLNCLRRGTEPVPLVELHEKLKVRA
jgi:rfaE bifunctional protein kinase chain/domain